MTFDLVFLYMKTDVISSAQDKTRREDILKLNIRSKLTRIVDTIVHGEFGREANLSFINFIIVLKQKNFSLGNQVVVLKSKPTTEQITIYF